MKDSLLEREDCNVICVDWAGGAKRLYEQSVGNTRLVAFSFLQVISESNFHLRFAFNPQLSCSRFLSFISVSGLDPAAPYYTERDPQVRLDPTDAKYVDVIHTNLPIIGTEQRVGHIDFFPNGGSVQVGCFTNKPLGE